MIISSLAFFGVVSQLGPHLISRMHQVNVRELGQHSLCSLVRPIRVLAGYRFKQYPNSGSEHHVSISSPYAFMFLSNVPNMSLHIPSPLPPA